MVLEETSHYREILIWSHIIHTYNNFLCDFFLFLNKCWPLLEALHKKLDTEVFNLDYKKFYFECFD